jgi:hypothetical protein
VYAMGRGMANWGNIPVALFVWISVHQFTAGTSLPGSGQTIKGIERLVWPLPGRPKSPIHIG